MPRKREPSPPDYDPFAERPRCGLTKAAIKLLKDRLGKRNLKGLPRYIEACVSRYLSWTVQIKRRPKRGSRSDTLRQFIVDLTSLLATLGKAAPLEVNEYLAKARSFTVRETGKSGMELILGLPDRLTDFRTALRRIRKGGKAGESAKMDFCEGQLAKVAYLLNHVTDLEPRFADELDGLLGPEVLNHVCSPLIRIQHELELVQKAASALLKTNSVPGGPEPRNALADLIGLLVERYEKLTGERFTHSPYGPRTAGKYIGKPESKAGIFLVEILHPDAYVIKHSGETEYEWPTEKQIATAMRQFIARRNKQAKSKI